MGADEEVWQDPGAAAAGGAIPMEHLARKEERGARNLPHYDLGLIQHCIEILDPLEAHRQFSIDDAVDCDGAL